MSEVLEAQDEEQVASPALTPLVFPQGFVQGKYASFDVSPEPMFGPDELGDMKSAVEDMTSAVTLADSSARLWEVLQAWEPRLFSRGYQFLTASYQGWSMNNGKSSPAQVFQAQNAGKMFACNVYSAREDKIVAALSREVPSFTMVPKRDNSPMDQTCADEGQSYLKCWLVDAGIKDVVGKIASLFYTDGTAVLETVSVADEQRWGTETPDKQETFGDGEPDGVTPETEMQPAQDTEQPAVREVTRVYGKLERKVPIYADDISEMGWARLQREVNANTLKERYPWIEDKITAGVGLGDSDQLARQARINVRLAVQNSSSSGESVQSDATETKDWHRPSQYRAIKDRAVRDIFYQYFPDGLCVVHAGGELAFIRNESMSSHLAIVHAKHGSGQNRRAIGSNYLPLQKILNANISLFDKYLRSAVPRRYAAEGPLDVAAMNAQTNDPGRITPVVLGAGQSIEGLTGMDKVPQPTTGMLEFIQWLISGAPEVMDGAQPAMFGAEDADTFGATKLNRDQALQVFSMPWGQICTGLAMAAQQAVACAADNRVANIRSNVPGEGKLQIEISKLRGNALCYPESMEIPQTIAEQEAQMADLLENSKEVAIYQAIANDPRNLTTFSKFPSLAGLEIPGVDSVKEQQGEFELLTDSGPLPNPKLAQIQQQITEGQTHPEAQTPEGMQAMQQLQQAAKQLPPQVSSVTVAQDGSQNHAIHAALTLGLMTSAEGRKLKNGNDEQKAAFQNLSLHWAEHEQMKAKLTPVPPIDAKFSVTAAIDKAPPSVQAQAWGALGVQAPVADWESPDELVPHETIIEKEGVDAQGVPVKQKISMTNPSGKLN